MESDVQVFALYVYHLLLCLFTCKWKTELIWNTRSIQEKTRNKRMHKVMQIEVIKLKHFMTFWPFWHQDQCHSFPPLFCIMWTLPEALYLYLHAYMHCTAAKVFGWLDKCTGILTGVANKVDSDVHYGVKYELVFYGLQFFF